MNILIMGGTGMVGSEVVRQAIADPSISQITLIVRRDSGFNDPKVKQFILSDFTNYSGLENIFRQTDACIWCLGISQSRVSKSMYYEITYTYAVAAAKAMLTANPDMTFLFLSGEGADSTERSPIRFARIKGKAENALINMHPKKLFIFRPGGIAASTPAASPGFFKRAESILVKIMAAVFPWSVISTKDLALKMLRVVKEGYGKTILSHRNIKNL